MSDGDAVRQAVVAAAVGGGFLAGVSGDYGSASQSQSLVLPADYAFAIWAPIYAGVLGQAVYQALPSQRQNPLLRRTGWAAAAAVGLSGGLGVGRRRSKGAAVPGCGHCGGCREGLPQGSACQRGRTALGRRPVAGAGAAGTLCRVDHAGLGCRHHRNPDCLRREGSGTGPGSLERRCAVRVGRRRSRPRLAQAGVLDVSPRCCLGPVRGRSPNPAVTQAARSGGCTRLRRCSPGRMGRHPAGATKRGNARRAAVAVSRDVRDCFGGIADQTAPPVSRWKLLWPSDK